MAEEGKMSRAISKAGAGDRLSAEPKKAPAPASPAIAAAAPEAIPAASEAPSSLRLVRGRFGTPADTVIMVHDRFGEVASQVRGLRARILAMNDSKPPRTITVTSASREEGKTTIAFNLGAAFAELGEGRVAVVDGDLVAPGLHLLANVDAQTGLNEVLDNGLYLDDNVYETAVPNLDLIPSRPIDEENAYEGALGQNCAALLKKLRRFYAYVIIDTPPVLAASQACTFAKHSDGVLVLARLERTPREVVKRGLEELTHSGATVLGCVLTHRKHHIPDFIYRFFGSTPHYYYSYGRSRDKTGKSAT
jgi:capsular exopolysaccharide synthesis family protein